jgi:hypothetical protein
MTDESAQDDRFEAALARFVAAHREDSRALTADGVTVPWSVHYHRRLLYWVLHFDPAASVALRLAAACQHIRRWTVPRDSYPEGRVGYKRWRGELARRHAEMAGEILVQVGFDADTVARVQALVKKTGLGRDPEVQVLEDAVCLVFLENEYVELAGKHSDEKVVEILRKTWEKMSDVGRAAAVGLAGNLPPRERGLVEMAVR